MAESARSGGVRIESRGHVGVCTIDDPSTRNALGPELMRAIVAGLERLDEDPEVRVIALVGRNEVFATGADPRVLAAAEPDAEAETDFWARFDAIGAPIVAGTSGWALGAGCELALACDLVVASKTARFGQPEVALGLIPGGGAIVRLTHSIGRQRTMELVLSGGSWSAEQAHGYGLVNEVADRRRWLEATLTRAELIAERAQIALRLAKRAVIAAERDDYARALETARALLAEAMKTEDRGERVPRKARAPLRRPG